MSRDVAFHAYCWQGIDSEIAGRESVILTFNQPATKCTRTICTGLYVGKCTLVKRTYTHIRTAVNTYLVFAHIETLPVPYSGKLLHFPGYDFFFTYGMRQL